MKIIAKETIQAWYRQEYSHLCEASVYGEPPHALQLFFDVLAKSENVRTVLEVGCGDGRNLIELAKRGFTVTGIDLWGKEAVDFRAKELGLALNFIQADITEFPFETNTYDALISSEVFHLIERRFVDDLLARMKSATNAEGWVYISILTNLKRVFLETGEEFKYEDQPDYTGEEARQLLQMHFQDWRILQLDTFHDEQDWPRQKGSYPVEPYHWSGDYVCIIAQRK